MSVYEHERYGKIELDDMPNVIPTRTEETIPEGQLIITSDKWGTTLTLIKTENAADGWGVSRKFDQVNDRIKQLFVKVAKAML